MRWMGGRIRFPRARRWIFFNPTRSGSKSEIETADFTDDTEGKSFQNSAGTRQQETTNRHEWTDWGRSVEPEYHN